MQKHFEVVAVQLRVWALSVTPPWDSGTLKYVL